jgi:hypothetical protein
MKLSNIKFNRFLYENTPVRFGNEIIVDSNDYKIIYDLRNDEFSYSSVTMTDQQIETAREFFNEFLNEN